MNNKTFIVTGSSGIAADTIKLLLKEGANVFFIGRSLEGCEAFQAEISEMGFKADFVQGDLNEVEVCKKLVEKATAKTGRIDGLYNVAGISGRKFGDGPLHECTEEGWATVLNTNASTQYRMCHLVINKMLEQEPDEHGQRGVILNMASILGIDPEPKNFNAIAYAASKGAILSMTKAAAAYYAEHKIRINAIAPGLAYTKMSARASQNDEIVNFMKIKQPLKGSVMTSEEVADASFFMLSEKSKMMTGQTLVVDAGWSIS